MQIAYVQQQSIICPWNHIATFTTTFLCITGNTCYILSKRNNQHKNNKKRHEHFFINKIVPTKIAKKKYRRKQDRAEETQRNHNKRLMIKLEINKEYFILCFSTNNSIKLCVNVKLIKESSKCFKIFILNSVLFTALTG